MAAMNSILSNGCQSEWNILSQQFSCQEATVRHIPDIPRWGFIFQQDGALEHRARDTVTFLEQKMPDFISPTLWPPNSPELNPVDCSIWSVLQEKVYRSTIANVSELDMRPINEDALSSRSWMLLLASDAVVSALVSVEQGTL